MLQAFSCPSPSAGHQSQAPRVERNSLAGVVAMGEGGYTTADIQCACLEVALDLGPGRKGK